MPKKFLYVIKTKHLAYLQPSDIPTLSNLNANHILQAVK